MSARGLRRVLIANRGEIAVRVIRACREAGLGSVAVFAASDAHAPFTQLADAAISLDGATARDTYLSAGKLLAAARRSGADAVHPGYGFLAENADFAAAVIDAGLTWIGPSPEAIRRLGDKVTARGIAAGVDAPRAPGTSGAVAGPRDVIAFAAAHGYPVAIKAALGGGGRGLRVVRSDAEVPAQLESARREAAAAFGSDACFAERYLDRARHVEAQVIADSHGNVVIAGTRDCTLQRRYQKLVEEAPAPFLSDAQRAAIAESARAICRAAAYEGAGTVEYLLGADGTITFLEVNTRLQVEHPVTEEVTGIDLVREQFRIAAGERLSLDGDPQPRGHAIEFRINAEDPGRAFLPAQGTITRLDLPAGPGVRVDSGVAGGSVVGGQFDSLLAKLIVTGTDRDHALQRARRALAETAVEGVATVLPFHRAVVDDHAFTGGGDGFGIHTRWIETEFQADIPPYAASPPAAAEPVHTVIVGGRRLRVSLPAAAASIVTAVTAPTAEGGNPADGDMVSSPMQGVVISIVTERGSQVRAGEPLMVLEAMKMENPVVAHKAGRVTAVPVRVGQSVSEGTVLCRIEE